MRPPNQYWWTFQEYIQDDIQDDTQDVIQDDNHDKYQTQIP